MKKSRARRFLNLFAELQESLFSLLEPEMGELSTQARLLVSILGLVPVHAHLPSGRWLGRPAKHRRALASAFVAKAVYGLETTRQLMNRLRCDRQLLQLCGWSNARHLPHESTFSRAFDEFATTELPQRLHMALIQKTQKDRLIGHIARDSTAIEAREKFPETKLGKAQRQRRPKRAKASERGTRLDRQRKQGLAQQVAGLSKQCSIGVKTSSKGHQHYWRGYKLHLDVATDTALRSRPSTIGPRGHDGQIPISALITGANVHDSQAAIPLMTLTNARVTYLYELMEAAY
ncbi:MAG: transposase, partial [Acidobacteriota bacterium]|nr:transposase [Acidobacteriota bacterium]